MNIDGAKQVPEPGIQPIKKHAVTAAELIYEGERLEVTLTLYERDPRARKLCLAHYGERCSVCDLSFEKRYGPVGKGFMHLHHLEALASAGASIVIDPVRNLRPVCPNCHVMLHRNIPPLTIEVLRAMLRTVA